MKIAGEFLVLAFCAVLATSAAAQVPDHLKCYKVKDPQVKATYTADLEGLTLEGCLIKVPAKLACVPATKTNVDPLPPGTGGSEPTHAFGCYKIRCPRGTLPPLQLNDQFGSRVVTPTAPKLLCAPVASTLPQKLVFVTSATGNGNLSTWGDAGGGTGLAAADNVCQARATVAGLPGSYMAWLSNSTASAALRLTHSAGPYVLPGVGGAKVADDWADLTDGSLDAPINLTENGTTAATATVWTGTGATGSSSSASCSEWTTSSAAGLGTCGSTNGTTAAWTEGCGSELCNTVNRLYCLQQ